MPAEARGTSVKSAEAFVRYWVTVLNFASATGRTQQLENASAPECRACAAVIASIREVYDAKGSYKGDGWRVTSLSRQPFQPKSRPVLTTGVHISRQVVVKRSGAPPKTFKGGDRSMIFRLQAQDGEWTVLEVDQPS